MLISSIVAFSKMQRVEKCVCFRLRLQAQAHVAVRRWPVPLSTAYQDQYTATISINPACHPSQTVGAGDSKGQVLWIPSYRDVFARDVERPVSNAGSEFGAGGFLELERLEFDLFLLPVGAEAKQGQEDGGGCHDSGI